jgi:hypothetical protein
MSVKHKEFVDLLLEVRGPHYALGYLESIFTRDIEWNERFDIAVEKLLKQKDYNAKYPENALDNATKA